MEPNSDHPKSSKEGQTPSESPVKKTLEYIQQRTGFSGFEIATRAGVAPSMLSLILKDRRSPTPETLRKISAGLGLDPEIWAIRAPRQDVVTILTAEAWAKTRGELSRAGGPETKRSFRRWEGLDDDATIVSYRAHEHMIRRGYYRYLALQDIDSVLRPSNSFIRLPANLSLQMGILEVHPCDASECRLDAHLGEEIYHTIEGETHFVVMATSEKPLSEYSQDKAGGPFQAFVGEVGECEECCALMHVQAIDTVLKQHPAHRDYVESQCGDALRDRRTTGWVEVRAVKYRLKAGTSFSVDSTWPHGGYVPRTALDGTPLGPARLHLVSFGSAIDRTLGPVG